MPLSCPTNWDDRLLQGLQGLPVGDVYGKLPADPLGGGRPGYLLKPLSRRSAAAHIRRARDQGLGFTYLLNAPCAGNQEFSGRWRRRLLDFVCWLEDTGITGVTVSIPLLAELLKQRFPALWVKVSVIAHVASVERARAWVALGVDEITLDFNVNRDQARLRQLANWHGCTLSLLLNDLCLQDCPFRHYHYNLVGHASAEGPRGPLLDYCFLSCHSLKLQDPLHLLRSPWIRPEDLPSYEALGFQRFKLAGRSKDTASLLRTARAYAARRYDGNLLDILEGTSRETSGLAVAALKIGLARTPGSLSLGLPWLARLPSPAQPFATLLARLPRRARPDVLRAYLALTGLSQAIHLNNRALDGFLDDLWRRGCQGLDDCSACPHCAAWGDRALRIDLTRVQRMLTTLQPVLAGVVSGAFLPER